MRLPGLQQPALPAMKAAPMALPTAFP